MTLEALEAIRAVEVESPPGFDGLPLAAPGATPFASFPPDVALRPQQAVSALAAEDALIQVYEYSGPKAFQGCRLVTESDPPFVLFAFGVVMNKARSIDFALRVYSDDPEELSRLAKDPSGRQR
jgi:hypothetical protein